MVGTRLPESFKVLMQELRALALNVTLLDKNKVVAQAINNWSHQPDFSIEYRICKTNR